MTDPIDDRDLALRAAQGDPAAFGELVRRHQAAVFNVAYRMMGRRRDAEDAAQETFLRAFGAFDRFDVERPLAPWLKRIAVNVCLTWLGSARARSEWLAADVGRPDDDLLARWPGGGPTPEQMLVAGQQTEQVRTAVLQLPPHYRATIELRHFQGLSYAEMAEVLERPLSSVKSDLFRARKMLGQLLQGRL